MSQIYEYCPVVKEEVTVRYHSQEVPVLGKGIVEGSNYVDECSHMEQCDVSDNNCPVFKKLNNI